MRKRKCLFLIEGNIKTHSAGCWIRIIFTNRSTLMYQQHLGWIFLKMKNRILNINEWARNSKMSFNCRERRKSSINISWARQISNIKNASEKWRQKKGLMDKKRWLMTIQADNMRVIRLTFLTSFQFFFTFTFMCFINFYFLSYIILFF